MDQKYLQHQHLLVLLRYVFNILFLDEFAFVPNHIAEAFFSSVYPTITSGKTTKVIMVSTPHGMNHFIGIGTMQKGKNEYIPTDVHWSQVPVGMMNGEDRLLQTHLNSSLRLSLSVSS